MILFFVTFVNLTKGGAFYWKLVNIVHIFLITHEVRFVRIKERKGFRFGKVKQLVMKNFL
jgi:hypothetical protein